MNHHQILNRLFLLLLLASTALIGQAQVGKPMKGPSLKKAPDIVYIPYCSEAIPKLSSSLQQKANATCQTQQACILCREQSSGHPLYTTMFFQPDAAVCAASEVQVTSVEDAKAGKAPDQTNPPPFLAEILQSTCINGGNTLEVYIVGKSADSQKRPDEYTYLWTVDGNKAGHASSVDCACGQEATVRITEARTGASVTKLVRLRPCTNRE